MERNISHSQFKFHAFKLGTHRNNNKFTSKYLLHFLFICFFFLELKERKRLLQIEIINRSRNITEFHALIFLHSITNWIVQLFSIILIHFFVLLFMVFFLLFIHNDHSTIQDLTMSIHWQWGHFQHFKAFKYHNSNIVVQFNRKHYF